MPPSKKARALRSNSSKKRQTTLKFPVVPSSSPLPHQSATEKAPPAKGATTSKTRFAVVVDVKSPKRSEANGEPNRATDGIAVPEDSSEDEDPIPSSTRKQKVAIDADNEDDDDDKPRSVFTRRGRGKIVEASDSVDVLLTPGKTAQAASSQTQESPTPQDQSAAGPSDKGKARATSDDSDDTLPTRRRRKRVALRTESSGDSIITPVKRKRISNVLLSNQSGGLQRASEQDESSDDLEIIGAPKETATDGDEADLGSDRELAFQTPTVKSRTRYAGSSSKKKTPYQEHLAILKAQRERRSAGALSSQSDSTPQLSEDDEVEMTAGQHFGGNGSDMEDFVVEDNPDDLFGAPDDIEIPLEFTAASHQSNSENFRIYCHWLVLQILFPDEFPKDEIVRNALRRLETSTAGFGDSVVQSGAWKPSFVRALKGRPELQVFNCPPASHCDACNRNDRGATRQVKFRGRRYHQDTLDDLSSDEDDETQDSIGEDVASEDTAYTLGNTCFYRTQKAHAFWHWKKELRDWLAHALKKKKIINRRGNVVDEDVQEMDHREKEAWACGITATMADSIQELYGDYKSTIQSARENMAPGRWGKSRENFM